VVLAGPLLVPLGDCGRCHRFTLWASVDTTGVSAPPTGEQSTTRPGVAGYAQPPTTAG
jgi:hypothetical protein